MQEHNRDAKMNLAHDDDDCGYNLDGSLNLCVGEDLVETRHGQLLKFDSGEGPFFDDLTKQQLPTALVKSARKKELDDSEMKTVWNRVPAQDAWKLSGRPPITVWWVDVNKGDDEVPNIRSFLVARHIRGCNEDPMFAPTPPLEALRTVLSYATTDVGRKAKMQGWTIAQSHPAVIDRHIAGVLRSATRPSPLLLRSRLGIRRMGPHVVCCSNTCMALRLPPRVAAEV